MSVSEKDSRVPVNIALLTVSDSRTRESDQSGDTLAERALLAGHRVVHRDLVRDEVSLIEAVLLRWIDDRAVDVVISTGGTGITGRDVTPEAFALVMEKEIPGFGELFRMLSYAKIGVSALQSRAVAGLARGTYLFALPGSPSAVADAWDDILVHQLDSQSAPCNLVELMPRLNER
jgi:molybdenum cofactor biosynthesis protein B